MKYITDQIKNNIIFIKFNGNLDLSKFTNTIDKIFKSVIPAHIAYVIISELEELIDSYDLDLDETVEVQDSLFFEDQLRESIDYIEGYTDIIKIGHGFVIGDGSRIGEVVFTEGPTIIEG